MGTYTKYNQQLLNDLFKYCEEKATGTLTVATGGSSCQIVIDHGVLISASYGQHKGLAALQAFKELNAGHCKFSNDYQLKMKAIATIEDNAEALELLGFNQYLESLAPPPPKVMKVKKVIEPTPVEIVEPEQKIVGMYRGQPIYEENEVSTASEKAPDSKPDEPEITLEDLPKKTIKMYRGKPIHDDKEVSAAPEKTTNSKSDETAITQQDLPKKPVRMYRGQVVK